MTKKSRFKNEMQKDIKAAPIVENAKLPKMDDPAKDAAAKGNLMMPDAAVKSEKAMKDSAGKEGFMTPVSKELSTKKSSSKEIAPQKESPKARSKSKVEGYVSLRLRVTGDKISVVGGRTVEGPLVTPEKIHSGLIYEANFDRKRIGFGWIAEAAERRSFPPPKPAPGQEGHHITELSSFEFNARITKEEFAKANLPDIEVSVYRVKEEPISQSFSSDKLGEQFNRELREVARLKGINLSKLNDSVRKELQNLK